MKQSYKGINFEHILSALILISFSSLAIALIIFLVKNLSIAILLFAVSFILFWAITRIRERKMINKLRKARENNNKKNDD